MQTQPTNTDFALPKMQDFDTLLHKGIPEDQIPGILELEALIESNVIREKDTGFCTSLVNAGRDHPLSEKQYLWVGKMIRSALSTGDSTETTPEAPAGGDPKLSALLEFFKNAKVKWPKITFEQGGHKLVMARAGSASKFPGCIQLTDGRGFGENIWYGRITIDGKIQWGNIDDEEKSWVHKYIYAVATDPAGVAATYGKESGNCCFCNKHLTHDNSLTVGYGPTCAKNFHLHDEWKSALKDKAA